MRTLPIAAAAAVLSVLAQAPPTYAQTAQGCYFQQRADYVIRAVLDPTDHGYRGEETIAYANNSPDTLSRLFFHLYPNAFQPGSMMDVRSRTIEDPDRRVGDRIAALAPGETGQLHIGSISVDGAPAQVREEGTIAEVVLAEAVPPGATVTIRLDFTGQVPVQIRRSGRDNAEGVDYSMPQWYPKLSEYDRDGWHPNPYVGREFYGVWGDFDVTVALPEAYVFASSGYGADAETPANDAYFGEDARAAGEGYRLHRALAPEVHDFTWAADPDFARLERRRGDGVTLEAYYLPGENTTENWNLLLPIMDAAMTYANEHFGPYPYEKYAFVQGGDGGMEYAMMTLITGERSLGSLVGVSVHEMMHSWYQFVLATDEAQYPWMDEGFTSYASAEVMNHLVAEGHLPGAEPDDNPHAGTVAGFPRFANTGRSEALSTHADHYTTNAAYSVGSYGKGELFLYQLRTVIGAEAFDRGMLRYYDTWKMRHPTGKDFLRVMERESGQVLDWYYDYMINTTHQVDYAVDTVTAAGGDGAVVALSRVGQMPFPVTATVTLDDGSARSYLIPVDLQRGHAPLDGRELAPDWPWTNPRYELSVPVPAARIASVSINAGIDHSESDVSNDSYPVAAAETPDE